MVVKGGHCGAQIYEPAKEDASRGDDFACKGQLAYQ